MRKVNLSVLFCILLSSNLAFSQSPPSHSHIITVYQYEDFSFASRGMNGAILGGWSSAKMDLTIGQETVHRFEKTETVTALWAQRHFKESKLKQRVNAGFSYSPKFKDSKEKILPQWRSSIGYGFLPFGAAQDKPHKKMVLDADYKFANYDTADNHSFSLASEYYPFPRIYFLLRANQIATHFSQTPEWIWNSSVSVQPVIELLPEKLNLSLLYAYSKEPFEAGAPGEIRSFQADLFHLGITYQRKQLKFRCGYDYEARSNSRFVRRWTFFLSQRW